MSVERIYLGIDPGISGGLASIFPDGSVDMTPMPDTIRDVWEWIGHYAMHLKPYGVNTSYTTYALIEKVGGYMGHSAGDVPTRTGEVRGNRAAAHTMFVFGQSFGQLQAFLTAAQIPYEEVLPRKWQGMVDIPHRAKSESRTDWKNRLKQKAQQLFPGEHVTLKTCDALLIAEACRRFHANT